MYVQKIITIFKKSSLKFSTFLLLHSGWGAMPPNLQVPSATGPMSLDPQRFMCNHTALFKKIPSKLHMYQ